jgi:hypothetical protein
VSAYRYSVAGSEGDYRPVKRHPITTWLHLGERPRDRKGLRLTELEASGLTGIGRPQPEHGGLPATWQKGNKRCPKQAAQYKHGRIYAPGSIALMLASAWRPHTPNDQRKYL